MLYWMQRGVCTLPGEKKLEIYLHAFSTKDSEKKSRSMAMNIWTKDTFWSCWSLKESNLFRPVSLKVKSQIYSNLQIVKMFEEKNLCVQSRLPQVLFTCSFTFAPPLPYLWSSAHATHLIISLQMNRAAFYRLLWYLFII